MAKIFSHVLHGNGKNYARRGSYANDATYAPPRPGGNKAADDLAEVPYIPPRPKSRPGEMPAEMKQDIIDRNRQDQAEAHATQKANYAQSDRRLRAIKTAQLEESRNVSREQDMANLLAKNPPASQVKARPAVPVVQPAGSTRTSAATQQPGMPYVPPRPAGQMPGPLGRAMATQERMGTTLGQENALHRQDAEKAAALQPGSPEMTAAGQALDPNSPENVARRSASPNPLISDVERETTDMQNRTNAINRVNTGQARILYPDRTSPGGVAGVRDGQVEIYNQVAPPRVAPPASAPIVTSDQTQFGPTRPVLAGDGSLEDRLEDAAARAQRRLDLVALSPDEVNRRHRLASQVDAVRDGQDAIDQGTSLERQDFERQEAQQREHEIALAAAGNPPRSTAGTDPALADQRRAEADLARARVQDLKAKMPEAAKRRYELAERRLTRLEDALRLPSLSNKPADQARAQNIQRQIDALEQEMGEMLDATSASNAGANDQPTAESIAKLKANPALRDAFDEKFGPGAAARHLGQ